MGFEIGGMICMFGISIRLFFVGGVALDIMGIFIWEDGGRRGFYFWDFLALF